MHLEICECGEWKRPHEVDEDAQTKQHVQGAEVRNPIHAHLCHMLLSERYEQHKKPIVAELECMFEQRERTIELLKRALCKRGAAQLTQAWERSVDCTRSTNKKPRAEQHAKQSAEELEQ